MLPPDFPASPPSPPSPEYIQELLCYIVENIDGDLTTRSLAERFFVSCSKLTEDFRRVTQISLYEYVTTVRIDFAKRWLGEGVPISVLAQRCGFRSDAAFIAMFHRRTGMTPGEYRTRIRENSP